jgi:sigma-B regulation protein RsbU (phosphoserine phosphatase)
VATHLSRQHLERAVRHSRDRLDRELASAAQMQRLILPAVMPAHDVVTFAAYYETSRHAGGDYYDVLPLGDDRFGIMVADVSGHGAPAAIVMAMIRAVLHTYPGTPDDPPAVLHHINRHFRYLWETAMYATAVYAVLDARRRTLRLSSAGHPPPYLVRGTDATEGPGFSQGNTAPIPIDTVMCLLWNELGDVPSLELPLQSGDRVVFFTDGITERQAGDDSMYDTDRLAAALSAASHGPPADIVRHLVDDLEAFARGHEPDDDQTVVVVGTDWR